MSTIPINDTAPRIQYTASAAQTVFVYPFWITSDQDLDVYVDGALKIPTTDYTVLGVLASNGGDITFVTPLNAGQIVTIERNMAFERISEFQEAGTFKAGVLNLELSKMIGMMQQLKRDIGRKLGLSPTSLVNQVNLLLPDPVDGKALVFDGTTGAMRTSGVNVDDIDSSVSAASASAEAAEISETNAAANSTAAQTAQTNAETAQAGAENARDTALAAVGNVEVSANDTTTGNLEAKIVAGTGISISTLNEGGNEQLQITNSSSGPVVASQTEAEAGTDNTKMMTPLRVGDVTPIIDRAFATTNVSTAITTTLPYDDTAPTSSEGTQVLSATLTPKTTTNKIAVRATVALANASASSHSVMAVFRGTTCIGYRATTQTSVWAARTLTIEAEDAPATMSPVTYTVRVGKGTGVGVRLNGDYASRKGGAKQTSTLEILELRA